MNRRAGETRDGVTAKVGLGPTGPTIDRRQRDSISQRHAEVPARTRQTHDANRVGETETVPERGEIVAADAAIRTEAERAGQPRISLVGCRHLPGSLPA